MLARPPIPTPSAREVTTEFLPLLYSSVPASHVQMVRLAVPRAALASFGLAPLEALDRASTGTVLADVLVGDDGLARAVRFVRPAADQSNAMKRLPRLSIACAAAWLVAAVSTADAQTMDFLSSTNVSAPIVRNAPFSGEGVTTVTQTLADGTRIERTTTSKFYRDSAGRVRRDQTIVGLGALDPSRESETLVTIVDPYARTTYVLNPATRVARRAPPPPPPPPGGDSRAMSASGQMPGPPPTTRPPPPPPSSGPPPPPPPPPPGGDVRLGPKSAPSKRSRWARGRSRA